MNSIKNTWRVLVAVSLSGCSSSNFKSKNVPTAPIPTAAADVVKPPVVIVNPSAPPDAVEEAPLPSGTQPGIISEPAATPSGPL